VQDVVVKVVDDGDEQGTMNCAATAVLTVGETS
jgi:hypothetical protein